MLGKAPRQNAERMMNHEKNDQKTLVLNQDLCQWCSGCATKAHQ